MVSGLHSTVTSASGVSGRAASTAIRPPAGTMDGVPPPKNTLVTGGRPSSTARSISVRSAWRYEAIRWSRSVQVAKAQ